MTPKDTYSMIEALLVLKTKDEARAFLDDLCTPSELRAFEERFQVAQMLDHNDKSYREISQLTGASTTTITRVARYLREMPHKGYRLVIDRLSPTTASTKKDQA